MDSVDDKRLASCSRCACFNLRKASRAITQLFDRAIKPYGLRGTQFSILVVLSAAGPETITRLSDILVMDRTTLTRNLRPMEKAGMIKLRQGEDPRSKRVSLTAKGRKVLVDAFPHWEKTQNRIMEKLGEERFASLIRDLSELSDRFSAKAAV
jgi:DNA-binding MarR family transcriptional regulator